MAALRQAYYEEDPETAMTKSTVSTGGHTVWYQIMALIN